jgi:hypothetical protein
MPIPQQLGRGNRMGRGPYEKSGLVQDSSLPPLRTVSSTYEIFFPFEEKENENGQDVPEREPRSRGEALVPALRDDGRRRLPLARGEEDRHGPDGGQVTKR